MATPVLAPRGRTVIVTVDPKLNDMTDPQTFHISKSHHDHVMWIAADPATSFTVKFRNAGPFHYQDFDDKNYPCSGLVRRDITPDSGKRYKYSVTANGRTVDPTGIIDP